MDAFADAREVERRSLEILMPFIKARAYDGRFVLIEKGRLARELQKSYGDLMINVRGGDVIAVEIKAEDENKHGNAFLETWSNRTRFTPGWMYTLKTDILLYHFIRNDELWTVSFPRLQRWFFHENKMCVYPEKKQDKREQLNDTWGRCVKIADLVSQCGMRLYRASTGEEMQTGTSIARQLQMFHGEVL